MVMVLRTTDSNKEPQLQKTKKMYTAFILDKGDYGLLRLQRKERVVYFSTYANPLYYTSDLLPRGFPAAF